MTSGEQNMVRGEHKSNTLTKDIYFLVKRSFDIVISTILLLALLPVFIAISLVIALTSGLPIYYVHKRVGRNGATLSLIKFRTMIKNADQIFNQLPEETRREFEINFKIENDPRITSIGRFLRKSSLDEIPQLLNILKGEMSLVGPRPITTNELEKYGENKEKFMSAMPGLTGYWQAFARSNCSYEQRMKMELFYVDNASVLLDLKVIFATFGAVLRGRGAM